MSSFGFWILNLFCGFGGGRGGGAVGDAAALGALIFAGSNGSPFAKHRSISLLTLSAHCSARSLDEKCCYAGAPIADCNGESSPTLLDGNCHVAPRC